MRHCSIIQVFRWRNPTGQTEKLPLSHHFRSCVPRILIGLGWWLQSLFGVEWQMPSLSVVFFLLQHKEQASQTSMNGYVCHHSNHRTPLWCQFTDIDVHTLSPLIPLGRPADVPAALMKMYCLRWQHPIGCIVRGLLLMSVLVRVLQVEWNWQIIGPILPIIRYSIVLCDIPVLPKII